MTVNRMPYTEEQARERANTVASWVMVVVAMLLFVALYVMGALTDPPDDDEPLSPAVREAAREAQLRRAEADRSRVLAECRKGCAK